MQLQHSERAPRSAALDTVSPSEIRGQLNRILLSQTFRTAEREKAFLRYVVERTMEGRAAELKEYTIGVEAFGRGDGFDPRLDTIVRTEARNVRRRLARYYEEEGHSDPVRIELPKGGYVPQFLESPRLDTEPVVIGAAINAEAQPAVVAPSEAPPRSGSFKLGRVKWWWVVGLTGVATIVVIAALEAHAPSFNRIQAVDAASIAVLPFQDLSGGRDKEGEILSDGLTEELIESLARIPHLRVVARASVFSYRGRVVDMRKAGREMSVRNILEGSIRISNGRVRIVAQLEDTTNGYQLWSQSFDRKFDDILAVQDQISTAIMQSLGVQLTGAANLKRGASPSPAAYQDFLQGLYFLNQSTAENIRTSIHYFDRAVASDPRFRARVQRTGGWIRSDCRLHVHSLRGKWCRGFGRQPRKRWNWTTHWAKPTCFWRGQILTKRTGPEAEQGILACAGTEPRQCGRAPLLRGLPAANRTPRTSAWRKGVLRWNWIRCHPRWRALSVRCFITWGETMIPSHSCRRRWSLIPVPAFSIRSWAWFT